MSHLFDRDNSGECRKGIEIEVSPFGVVEFNNTGRVKHPEEHADFLAWVEEQLARVLPGYSGFSVSNNGRVFHFDSLGHLMKAERWLPIS